MAEAFYLALTVARLMGLIVVRAPTPLRAPSRSDQRGHSRRGDRQRTQHESRRHGRQRSAEHSDRHGTDAGGRGGRDPQ